MISDRRPKSTEPRESWLREVAERAEESISQRDAHLLGPAARLLSRRVSSLEKVEDSRSEQSPEVDSIPAPSLTVLTNPGWAGNVEGAHVPMMGLVRD